MDGPLHAFYFRHPVIHRLFSINQIKNIKTLIIWLFQLLQVTTCLQVTTLADKISHSLTVTDRQLL